jgi:hypothetical protein
MHIIFRYFLNAIKTKEASGAPTLTGQTGGSRLRHRKKKRTKKNSGRPQSRYTYKRK